MTRLELLEMVNDLNVKAAREQRDDHYWTVCVLYNDVIYKAPHGSKQYADLHFVHDGIAK